MERSEVQNNINLCFVAFGRRKEEWSRVMLKNITETRGGASNKIIRADEQDWGKDA